MTFIVSISLLRLPICSLIMTIFSSTLPSIIMIAALKSLSQILTPELFGGQSLLHCLSNESMGHILSYIHMYNNFWSLSRHFELLVVRLDSLKNMEFFSMGR